MTKKVLPPLPDYRKPPVSEVAIAVQFDDLHGIPAPLLGDLWEGFGRKEFLKLENHPPVSSMPGTTKPYFALKDPLLEIPRVWFMNENEAELIQFQQDRMVFNWRKTKNSNKYPHYPHVIKKFEHMLKELEKFCEKYRRELTYEILELTYFNTIPFDDFGGAPNIGDCLKDAIWQTEHGFLPKPTKYNGCWEFELADLNGRMIVNIFSVQQADGKEILRMDITVRAQYAVPFDKNMKTMLSWYDKAHEHIVLAFDDLTTPKMHKKWGKHDRNI